MEAQKDSHRFSNKSLKNAVSQSGYKLFITEDAQKQIDAFEGHERVQIDKSIQHLASVPRPRQAGEPVIMLGDDHYRIRNGCCIVDYIVRPGEVTIRRVIYKKPQPKSGKIITIKGNLDDLPKDVRDLLDNAKFWDAVHGAQSRIKHYLLTAEKLSGNAGAAVYTEGDSFRFGDVSQSALKGEKYGSKSLLGGDFAGRSEIPIEGASAVVLSHFKAYGADGILKQWEDAYKNTSERANCLIIAGTRDRIEVDYVLFYPEVENPIIIRDERR